VIAMLTPSLQRISTVCKEMVALQSDLMYCEGSETVSVCRPKDGLWLEIEQAPRVGLDERISISEYRARARQVFYAGSAWEAITTITQRLEQRRR